MREEKGYITIEATIVLSIYLFMFLMIFSVIHLCRAQMKISVAINNSAKEISQYSYLYGLSGLNESLGNVAEKAQSEKKDYKDMTSKMGSLYSSISSMGKNKGNTSGIQSINITNIQNMYGQLDKAKTQASEIGSILKSKMDNPKETLMGITSILASAATEEAKNVLAENIAKMLVKSNLKGKSTDGDTEINAYLQKLGIKKTESSYLESIDFSNSKLFPNGKNEIKIVAVYELELLPLLNIDSSFTVCQTARTRGWLNGDQDKK